MKVSQLLSTSFFSPIADEVNLLDKITSHAQDLSNVSFSYDEANCSILEIGQYATLNIPTREAFGDRWAAFKGWGWSAQNHLMRTCWAEGLL